MPKSIIEEVKEFHLCSYGCGNQARYKNKSSKYMCDISPTKCIANRQKNSNGIKKAHQEGRIPGWKELDSRGYSNRGWAKGLTKETDKRIQNFSNSRKGKRRISDEEKLKKVIYREQCCFNLAGIIQYVKGYELLEQYGMYDRKKNPNGVVRDHRVSVDFGYQNNIDPKIISHPSNCEFMIHKNNASKTHTSSLTVEELQKEITNWCH